MNSPFRGTHWFEYGMVVLFIVLVMGATFVVMGTDRIGDIIVAIQEGIKASS
ncbi:MAG: hypothetical protein HYU86_03305 [Chloroflexi bacterium]|nr:hypothetical protein [Chloroflexota bacterium]